MKDSHEDLVAFGRDGKDRGKEVGVPKKGHKRLVGEDSLFPGVSLDYKIDKDDAKRPEREMRWFEEG